jgi:hypothetical protein
MAIVLAVDAYVCPNGARADDAVTYEIRQQITGALLPTHGYDVTGSCATGTGLAPASVYASGSSGHGEGLGVGVGARLGYEYTAASASGAGVRWRGFRVGGGLDLALLYGSVPTGMPSVSGDLCARVKNDGVQVQYQGSSMLLAQVPLFLGVEVGMGADEGNTGSHGVVFGAAWAPALTYVKPWVVDGDVSASYLGAELTLDFGTMRQGDSREASKRIAVFLLLPPDSSGPAVLTVSFGAVWQ